VGRVWSCFLRRSYVLLPAFSSLFSFAWITRALELAEERLVGERFGGRREFGALLAFGDADM